MLNVIQLALGVLMSSLGVEGHTRSCEWCERDQQDGGHECANIGMSKTVWEEGNARLNKLSAMRPSHAKLIHNVHITTRFERPETDLDVAKSACWIYYEDTWLS